MSILILATAINFNIISNIYKNLCDDISCIHITDTQQLVNEMTTDDASLAIVAIDGAAGMETVFTVRNISEDIPIFWFSDDINFGPQAYRLNCNYFSNKPITEMRILTATQRLNTKSHI